MTAEMVTMNKGAVSMAADSAVTVVGRKVYNSGSKLFPLSNKHSIGIMFYGNASLMGVPWETVVAEYRTQITDEIFDSVEDAGKHFINFLSGSKELFPEDLQKRFVLNMCRWRFSIVVENINTQVQNRIRMNGEIQEDQITEIIDQVVSSDLGDVSNAAYLSDISEEKVVSLKSKIGADLEQIANEIFQKLPVSDFSKNKIIETGLKTPFNNWFYDLHKSGIVLSGFGKKEIYPALFSFEIESVVEGVVKYSGLNVQKISDALPTFLQAFAQHDVAMSFLKGIDPNFRLVLDGYLRDLFNQLAQSVSQGLAFSDDIKKSVEDILKDHGNKALGSISDNLDRLSRERFVDPVMNALHALPKDELANMAETLVSLTSFRRKMSLDVETVGGPIDVAVISKKDGFIWIKRKHYFSPEFNPDYFERKK